MSKELVLQTKDLTDVGITSQLTSNDLLEVVATDLFDKFMAEITDVVKETGTLRDKTNALMQPEYDVMKSDLIKAKMVATKDSLNFGYSKVNGDDWAANITCHGLDVCEKDRGTKVTVDHNEFYLSYPKTPEAKVMIKATVGDREEDKDKVVDGIKCHIWTSVEKKFERAVTIKTERFKTLLSEIKEHNKRVDLVRELMPANGLLSVERFTREARVKMNKKILSAQSPDFRKKISQLFNIQL
jgi:hypothetical protein